MKLQRRINWSILIMIFLFANISCQDFEKDPSTSFKTDSTQAKVDTSIWLKETRGIRDILEDKLGNLWFSSPDYVAKFDGNDMNYYSENDGLSITGNLHEDSNGSIWIENGFRAFRYDGKRFFEEKIDSIQGSSGIWIQRGLNPTDTTYTEPGLYEINQTTTVLHLLPLKENVKNKYLYYPTTKAHFGKDSTVWIGTMEKVYGLNNNSFISLGRKEMGRQNDERQMGIRGIFIDSKGILWMADNGAGIFTYDGKETINFTKKHHLDQGEREGATLHRAFSIAEDSEENMWFGTVYSGIWRYNPRTEEFKNYAINEGVISENIWTIYQTEKGELLFAGESPAAVYVFNGNTFDRRY